MPKLTPGLKSVKRLQVKDKKKPLNGSEAFKK